MNVDGVGARAGRFQARVVDLIEEVFERSGHVPDVRGRAEYVAVRIEHVHYAGGQSWTHHDLDPFDLVIPRPGERRLQHRLHPWRGSVVYNEQTARAPAIIDGLRSIHTIHLTSASRTASSCQSRDPSRKAGHRTPRGGGIRNHSLK